MNSEPTHCSGRAARDLHPGSCQPTAALLFLPCHSLFCPFWKSQGLDEFRVKQGLWEPHSPPSTDLLCLHPTPTKPKHCCPSPAQAPKGRCWRCAQSRDTQSHIPSGHCWTLTVTLSASAGAHGLSPPAAGPHLSVHTEPAVRRRQHLPGLPQRSQFPHFPLPQLCHYFLALLCHCRIHCSAAPKLIQVFQSPLPSQLPAGPGQVRYLRPGEVPDPGTAPCGAGRCESPGGCEPLSDPVFSSGFLPPTAGYPPPFQQFPPRSKDRHVS